jgi:hypothetical protein
MEGAHMLVALLVALLELEEESVSDLVLVLLLDLEEENKLDTH